MFQKVSTSSERSIQKLLNADFFAMLLVVTDDSFNESGLRSWDRLRGRLRVLLRGRIAAGPLAKCRLKLNLRITSVQHVSLCFDLSIKILSIYPQFPCFIQCSRKGISPVCTCSRLIVSGPSRCRIPLLLRLDVDSDMHRASRRSVKSQKGVLQHVA